MTELEQLAARVGRIEDERAILERLHLAAQLLDTQNYQAYADCFSEGASFAAYAAGSEPRVIDGRAALATYRPYAVAARRHFVLEPVVDLDQEGQTATANSCFIVLEEHDGRPHVRVFGRYSDRLEKGDDGIWRLAERRVFGESWLGTPLSTRIAPDA